MKRHLITFALIFTTLVGGVVVLNVMSRRQEANSAEQVYVTSGGSKFHRESCRYITSSATAMERRDAVKEYAPCGSCFP